MSFFREGTENLSQIKIIYESPLLLLISMRIQNLSNKGLIEENKKLLEQLRWVLEQADGLEMVFAKHNVEEKWQVHSFLHRQRAYG